MAEDLRDAALAYHRLPKPGKLEVTATTPLANQRDLALAYSPGVAAACDAIVADPAEASQLTARANLLAVVTNGTDAPVEDVAPLANFHAMVTRLTKKGDAFFPEQKLTALEALKCYTLNNAYAAFEEALKGSLTPGKLADVVILSKDIMTIPEDEIPTAEVLYTIVGARRAVRRGTLARLASMYSASSSGWDWAISS
jgi:hypothetical protein